MEKPFIVWNDDTGDRVEIRDDGDGLDLTELRLVDPKGKITQRIAFDDDQLLLIYQGIKERLKAKGLLTENHSEKGVNA